MINIHIYPSQIKYESRILRIAQAIKKGGRFSKVHIVGMNKLKQVSTVESVDECVEIVRVSSPEKSKELKRKVLGSVVWQYNIYQYYKSQPVSCVNIHHISLLPLGVLLARKHDCPLIYDTHELETETIVSLGFRRYCAKILERLLIRRVDFVFVVGKYIETWYRETYKISNVQVILNFPSEQEGAATAEDLRSTIGVSPSEIVYLYQGILDQGRKIHFFVDVFSRVPSDKHLVLLGYGPLAAWAKQLNRPNIHVLPAVDPKMLLSVTKQADVGLVGVENVCLSYYYSMPNKLLQYISAGVPVMAPMYPEMRDLVLANRLGWTLPDKTEDWAKVITQMKRSDIDAFSSRLASYMSNNSWGREEEKLIRFYAALNMPVKAKCGN